MWKIVLLLVILTIASSFGSGHGSDNTPPEVQTRSGRVRGSFLTTRLGRRFYSFRAIRYAQPPVGDFRFRPPVEHSWRGVFDASEDGPLCPQPYFNNTSEDCLRINIYTPKLPNRHNCAKLPVIVFIHDGAFYLFGGIWAFRGPEYFLDHDVVLVTFNYRLGSLGYLSTGDAEAPGNNAMKDQVLALKWIQKNIEAFGGDKQSVTLLGYSAGGWSISLHMVSPMARGLFHRGIMMSGSALGIYPLPHEQIEIAKKQASLVGCPSDTSRNIVRCLRTKSAKEIGDSIGGFAVIGSNPGLTMTPVIEGDFGQERYLTDHPIKLIEQKNFYQVPLIVGRNQREFGYNAFYQLSNQTLVDLVNGDFEKYAPLLLAYESNTPKSRRVSRAIKKFYLNNQPLSNASLDGLSKLNADAVVGFAMQRAVELFSKNGDEPVYYYEVTYLGGFTEFYVPGTNNTVPYGVVHQDELIYLLYNSYSHPLFDENYPEDGRTVAKLTTLFVNFATCGNPTPKDDELFNNVRWRRYNLRSQKYLDFGKTLQIKDHMYRERYDFWSRLYPISDYLH